MLRYLVGRLLLLIPVLFVVSLLSFVILELPPGDYVSTVAADRHQQGSPMSESEQQQLREQLGLTDPILVQYGRWISNIVFEGDFGRSLAWSKPVSEVLAERVPLTMAVSLMTLVFVYAVSIPIGIYSATHKYSIGDYVFTFLGFLGLAIPGFLLALVLLWFFYSTFGVNMSGLVSQEFIDEAWSVGKVINLLSRIWFPVMIIGLTGTASLIRVMRANLLDELEKPYVTTARAKGLSERAVLLRYPVRLAINPIVSTVGWLLPAIVGGEVLVSIVLNLQTTGPVLLGAVTGHDQYLAAGIILVLSALTIIGTLLSDVLLAWVDPRVRFGKLGR